LVALRACSATTQAFAADLTRRFGVTYQDDRATGAIPVAFSCRNGLGALPGEV